MLKSVLTALLASALALPAYAQDSGAQLPSPDETRDISVVAGGVAWVPDYEGSDDYRIIPAAAIRAKVGGIRIFSRATWLYADFISSNDKVDFDVGPIVGVRLNRTRKVKDDFVDALPERDAAFEIGGFAGVSVHGLTNPYDTLGIRLDVVKDVGSAHESTVFTPVLEFGTPLSRFTYVSAGLSADFAGGGYADYYYSITAPDALASGLPVYDADGGMKDWKLSLLATHAITGDLTGGWSLFGAGSYSRLQGDFKDSPIVSRRGSASQWMGAIGVAYTF